MDKPKACPSDEGDKSHRFLRQNNCDLSASLESLVAGEVAIHHRGYLSTIPSEDRNTKCQEGPWTPNFGTGAEKTYCLQLWRQQLVSPGLKHMMQILARGIPLPILESIWDHAYRCSSTRSPCIDWSTRVCNKKQYFMGISSWKNVAVQTHETSEQLRLSRVGLQMQKL